MDEVAGEGHSLQNDTLPSAVRGVREANPHPSHQEMDTSKLQSNVSDCEMIFLISGKIQKSFTAFVYGKLLISPRFCGEVN